MVSSDTPIYNKILRYFALEYEEIVKHRTHFCTRHNLAKDIKTVVFTTVPQMHCENCENKIKGNLRFEKGIKDIQTSVPDQKVTIQYDADKTNPEKIAKGFAKIGYEATVVTEEAKKAGRGGCDKKK